MPFFSDELFRWAFWENKSGAGWDRKIKYTVKEYSELKERVDALRERIGKGAIEAEKVAYVLGKREADLSTSEKPEQASQRTVSKPPKKAVEDAKSNDAGPKRKATQATTPDEQSKPGPTRKKQKTVVPSTSQRVTRSSGKQ
jgi:hypothetical protein